MFSKLFEQKGIDKYLKPWVIVKRDYGQLGNRLHTHANILAWCKKNNYNLLNLSFREFACYYETSDNRSVNTAFEDICGLHQLLSVQIVQNFLNRLCLSERWLNRLSKFIRVIYCEDDETYHEEQLQKIKQLEERIIIIKAWDISCPKALTLQQDHIRQILTPTIPSVKLAEAFIEELKTKFSKVIGIHARRGDYKEFIGGKHYHSWEQYFKWICQVKKLFEYRTSDKVAFLICSDEEPDQTIFKSLPVYSLPQNNMMCEIHALSLCNYLLGPPSSFGTWAAWHGKVPRCVLEEHTYIEKAEQFSICKEC